MAWCYEKHENYSKKWGLSFEYVSKWIEKYRIDFRNVNMIQFVYFYEGYN